MCFPFARGSQFDLYKALCYTLKVSLLFILATLQSPSFSFTYMTSGVITVVPELPQWPTSKFGFLTAQIHSSSSSELPDFYWRNGQNCSEWGRGVRYARAQGGGHVHLIKGNYGTRGSSHQSPQQEAFPIPTPAGLVSHSAAGNDFPCLVCPQLLSAISLWRTTMRGLF